MRPGRQERWDRPRRPSRRAPGRRVGPGRVPGWRCLAALPILAALATACGHGPVEAPALPPPEVFTWGGQPISFSPPPAGWERQKAQQGGLRGVRFIKRRSVGEEVQVAEHYALDERDRCARLEALLRDLDNLGDRDRAIALQRARLYASPPLNGREERLAEQANEILDQARDALRRDDTVEARKAISSALEHAARIRYSLREVLDRVMLSPARFEGLPGGFEIAAAVPAQVAGEPAMSVDYTLHYDGRTYRGREVYVEKNNRLFVAHFQGLEENLPLFERILETVSFPPGYCVH